MKTVIPWILVGFAVGLALALPARFWIVIAMMIAALVFALGLWALWLIIAGMMAAFRADRG